MFFIYKYIRNIRNKQNKRKDIFYLNLYISFGYIVRAVNMRRLYNTTLN